MVKIYGIKNCGSVKKAIDFFMNKKIDYEFIDFKKTPPSLEKIQEWAERSSLEALLNKKGTTYKKLELKNKTLTPPLIQDYLLKEPMLIKRPVVEAKNKIFIGFDSEKYEEIQC
ncbi:arsenate reductase family protein [Helicobacter apodemus]|uniref:Arsenate reductase family protein n=1 Tax=Helicobacter apodemus TaxID=135569 RepID=A0A2U8FC99_9HELI|nr:arsenate reductase family protein [Helicobacter apodemus]AWI33638.1 arsenate reductase family protein [Helicobacter apodemus]